MSKFDICDWTSSFLKLKWNKSLVSNSFSSLKILIPKQQLKIWNSFNWNYKVIKITSGTQNNSQLDHSSSKQVAKKQASLSWTDWSFQFEAEVQQIISVRVSHVKNICFH